MKLTIYTDGGSRGNPGPAAAGVVIFDQRDDIRFSGGFFLGPATNNVAEYTALLRALDHAHQLGGTDLTVNCDSELLVKQINGLYRVKNPALKELYSQAMNRVRTFDRVKVKHVYRDQNTTADRLVNEALDQSADVGDAFGLNPDSPAAPPADLWQSAPSAQPVFLEVVDLRETTRFDPLKPTRTLLTRSSDLTAGLICLQPDQQHTIKPDWSQATITVMRGQGRIQAASEQHQLQPGTWLLVTNTTELEVTAHEQLVLIVTALE